MVIPILCDVEEYHSWRYSI